MLSIDQARTLLDAFEFFSNNPEATNFGDITKDELMSSLYDFFAVTNPDIIHYYLLEYASGRADPNVVPQDVFDAYKQRGTDEKTAQVKIEGKKGRISNLTSKLKTAREVLSRQPKIQETSQPTSAAVQPVKEEAPVKKEEPVILNEKGEYIGSPELKPVEILITDENGKSVLVKDEASLIFQISADKALKSDSLRDQISQPSLLLFSKGISSQMLESKLTNFPDGIEKQYLLFTTEGIKELENLFPKEAANIASAYGIEGISINYSSTGAQPGWGSIIFQQGANALFNAQGGENSFESLVKFGGGIVFDKASSKVLNVVSSKLGEKLGSTAFGKAVTGFIAKLTGKGVQVVTTAAVPAGGAAAGAATGAAATGPAAIIGAIVGAIVGFIVQKILPKITEWLKDNKEVVLALGGGLVGLFFVGLGLPFIAAGIVGLLGAIPLIQKLSGGKSFGHGLASFFKSLGEFALGTVLTVFILPAVYGTLGFVFLVAIILFIINSGAYVTAPPFSGMTLNCGVDYEDLPQEFTNTSTNAVTDRAYDIVSGGIERGLHRGFWCYWNKSPQYPQFFDEVAFKKDPNACVSSYNIPNCTGNYDGLNLFWCTQLIIQTYTDTGRSIGSIEEGLLYTPTMKAWFADTSRNRFISIKNALKDINNIKNIIKPGDTALVLTGASSDADTPRHASIIWSVDQDTIKTIDSNGYFKTYDYTISENKDSACWGSLCIMGIGKQ